MPYLNSCSMTRFVVSYRYSIQVLWSGLEAWSRMAVQSKCNHHNHRLESMSTLQPFHIPLPFHIAHRMNTSSVNIRYSIRSHTQVLEWSVSVLVAHTPYNHPFPPNRNLVPQCMIENLPS